MDADLTGGVAPRDSVFGWGDDGPHHSQQLLVAFLRSQECFAFATAFRIRKKLALPFSIPAQTHHVSTNATSFNIESSDPG